jgi:hypothetical protein
VRPPPAVYRPRAAAIGKYKVFVIESVAGAAIVACRSPAME